MNCTNLLNKHAAKVFVQHGATEKEIALLAAGNWQAVQNARNEMQTFGFIAGAVTFAKVTQEQKEAA